MWPLKPKPTIDEIASQAAGRGYIAIFITGGDLNRLFKKFTERIDNMANELDNLRAEIATNTSVTNSAIALLQGLKAQLDAAIASGDMSQVQALSDALGQNDVNLSSAITANTPTPAPEPAPPEGRRSPSGGTKP